MGRLSHVLKHRATPQVLAADDEGEWEAGERGAGAAPQPGVAFACMLFLPAGVEEANPFRPRNITRPTLLYEPTNVAGGDVELRMEMELTLVAANEAPPARALLEGRWQVDGDPQAFGPPGRTIGMMTNLQRVRG